MDRTANLKLAARRIVFGKFLNCGQTCVAPDYIYCDPAIKDQLIEEIKKEIRRQFTEDPLSCPAYGKIVNEKHFQRITALIDPKKTVWGGSTLPEKQKITPTVMDHVAFSDPVMQEEIFGPLLPVLTWDSLEEAVTNIHSMPHPLALYLFTRDKKQPGLCHRSRVALAEAASTIPSSIWPPAKWDLAVSVKAAWDAYHGKAGFLTFSHTKSIVDKKTLGWIFPCAISPTGSSIRNCFHLFLR